MGAVDFMTESKARSAAKAFRSARADAQYERGHGGYTGTIAEKDKFKMVVVPKGEDSWKWATRLLSEEDHWSQDKYGPCGCIDLDEHLVDEEFHNYLFFGYAAY